MSPLEHAGRILGHFNPLSLAPIDGLHTHPFTGNQRVVVEAIPPYAPSSRIPLGFALVAHYMLSYLCASSATHAPRSSSCH